MRGFDDYMRPGAGCPRPDPRPRSSRSSRRIAWNSGRHSNRAAKRFGSSPLCSMVPASSPGRNREAPTRYGTRPGSKPIMRAAVASTASGKAPRTSAPTGFGLPHDRAVALHADDRVHRRVMDLDRSRQVEDRVFDPPRNGAGSWASRSKIPGSTPKRFFNPRRDARPVMGLELGHAHQDVGRLHGPGQVERGHPAPGAFVRDAGRAAVVEVEPSAPACRAPPEARGSGPRTRDRGGAPRPRPRRPRPRRAGGRLGRRGDDGDMGIDRPVRMRLDEIRLEEDFLSLQHQSPSSVMTAAISRERSRP